MVPHHPSHLTSVSPGSAGRDDYKIHESFEQCQMNTKMREDSKFMPIFFPIFSHLRYLVAQKITKIKVVVGEPSSLVKRNSSTIEIFNWNNSEYSLH